MFNKKRSIISLLLVLFLCLGVYFQSGKIFVSAEALEIEEKSYTIYTEEGNFLFERANVEVGDEYLSKDFKKYQVITINENTLTGTAKFLYFVNLPQVDMDMKLEDIAKTTKKIGLYCTHNDESYVPTDGTESVYGAGGIHDVAKSIKSNLEKLSITTTFDETLHIPHDSMAYSRSRVTANKLMEAGDLDAIFDIHRDGTSRSYYVTNVDGAERCMVRIVVGKANPDYAINEQFALYLLAVANKTYPWLFKDIYYASGHYNQSISGKALLFEMGSHLVEKELVLKSVQPLCEVINTSLFNTTVNSDNGDLTINGAETGDSLVLTDALENAKAEANSGGGEYIAFAVVIVSLLAVLSLTLVLNQKPKKKTRKKNK